MTILSMWKSGKYDTSDIAKATGTAEASVVGIVHAAREKERNRRADISRCLHERGMSWRAIGRELGITGQEAKALVDEEYRKKRNARTWELRKAAGYYGQPPMPRSIKPNQEDLAARLAEIPPDTRDLTGRLAGDPLPGRSALDRKRMGLPV